MPTQVQFRRGSTAQNNSFTGAAGEITVNTSNNTIRVHDGTTAGGYELAKRGNISLISSSTSAELAAVISDETGSGALVFATSPTFTGLISAANLTLSGDLTVNGTTTTINSITLTVDDKNIELGSVTSPTDVTADGGGITLKGATDKTINWVSATNAWTSSEDLNLLTGKVYEINGATVLSASTLGSGVTASSLTSVGTIATGTWNGSEISTTYTAAKVTSVNGSTGAITGLATTAGTLGQFGATTSSALAGVISDETGSGALVFATSPTLVTPILGTPQSGTLTSCTGLPLSTGITGTLAVANGGTGTASPATVAGTGISVSGSFPNQTITNSGVTSLVAGTNIAISGGTGAVTVNVTGTVSAATNATNSTNSNITDDTTTNSTHYPNFVSGTSGNQAEKVSSTKLTFNPSTGLLTSTDYNSSSDKRLKKNIKTVESALDKVIALRGVSFDWKEGGAKAIGLIAQEAEKVIPEIVSQDDNGYLGIKYNNLIGVLIEAIKDQQVQIEDLKNKINKL
jgi:hypothetical protein